MIRFNNNVFITKELRKEIMKRSKLRNKFNGNRNHENWCNFKFQRNYYVNLLRKAKKQYYGNLSVMDNQTFLKTVKPYFSDKGLNSRRITLLENDSILTDDKDILPHVSKVFERIIYKQINIYMQDKLSKHITGFRKSHGTQHSLMTMLEKWKSALDKGENVCVKYLWISQRSLTQ